MRFAIQLRALVEIEADTQEQAIDRAREHVHVRPLALKVARVIEDPPRHEDRLAEPKPLPSVHRQHWRDGENRHGHRRERGGA